MSSEEDTTGELDTGTLDLDNEGEDQDRDLEDPFDLGNLEEDSDEFTDAPSPSPEPHDPQEGEVAPRPHSPDVAPPPQPATNMPVYNDAVAPSAEVRKLRGSAAAHKGHVTRIASVLATLTKEFTGKENTVTSPAAASEFKDYLDRLEDQREKLDNVWADLLEADPTNLAVYQDQRNQVSEQADGCIAAAIRVMGRLPGGAAPAGRAEANRGPRAAASAAKANLALQPKELSLTQPPTEVPKWLDQWHGFYSTSNLALLSTENQQAYFFQYLDTGLRAAIKAKVDAATPIYGADLSCVAALRQCFAQRYPLFQRRSQFFEHRHTGGIRDLPAFLQSCEDLATSAELETITRDSLIAFKALSSIKDTELRRLCAREEELSLIHI